MAVTNYYTVNGKIRGQHVLGEAEGKDYLLDASGNLVGVYQGDYLKADASYDPFGNILDSWNISFYNFTWAGGHGYRQTGLAYSSVYVRARHYSNLDGGWTTRDPLWPSEMPYGYVRGRVPGSVDPSGMAVDYQCNTNKNTVSGCIDALKGLSNDERRDLAKNVKECMASKGGGFQVRSFQNEKSIDWFLGHMLKLIESTKESVCIRCQNSDGSIPNWPKSCQNPCVSISGLWGMSYGMPGYEDLPPDDQLCGAPFDRPNGCEGVFVNSKGGRCTTSLVICDSSMNSSLQSPCAIVYHELAHSWNVGHVDGEKPPPGTGVTRQLDFIYKLGCCICMSLSGKDKCGDECARVWK